MKHLFNERDQVKEYLSARQIRMPKYVIKAALNPLKKRPVWVVWVISIDGVGGYLIRSVFNKNK